MIENDVVVVEKAVFRLPKITHFITTHHTLHNCSIFTRFPGKNPAGPVERIVKERFLLRQEYTMGVVLMSDLA